MASPLSGLRGRFERLSEREKRMVMALGATLVLCVVGVVAYTVNDGLTTLADENADMRAALKDLEIGKDTYARAKHKTAAVEAQMGRGGVQLQGFLEAASKESGVEIAETTERQPVPVGKDYLERAVDVRLRKVGVGELAKFLRHIETGPSLVVVTALNVRTRDDKHEDLEVEMTVSTYEHAPVDKSGHKKEIKG